MYLKFNQVAKGKEDVTTRLMFEYAQYKYQYLKDIGLVSQDLFHTCLAVDRIS